MNFEKKSVLSHGSPIISIKSSKITFYKNNPNGHHYSTIVITNKLEQHVAIKIKTNVPEYYIVKPNIFIINPLDTTEVDISCQHRINMVIYLTI